MLMIVLDGNGAPQTVSVQAQEATTDFSGTLEADDTSQPVAPANPNRAGLLFQNKGANAMTINDLGNAGSAEPSAYIVAPGQSWPPAGYPIPVTAINVAGTQGEAFLYREW